MSERVDSGRASGARAERLFPRVNARPDTTPPGRGGAQTTRRVADFHPSAPPGAGLVGRTLGGRYTLTRLLGRGGFGAVYHALQAPIERPVAVKVISGGQDPADLRRRFVLEARALAQVSAHPNGVGLIELGEEPDGLLYIVQDFIDGRSLDVVLREDGPLECDRAVGIVCAVLDALAMAHHHGIVHRDVKPSNVMLVTDHRGRERVKLLDFGIAHVVGAVRGGISPTATGVIVGSPQYMAPEQFSGEGISSRVDLYAAGVLLYELLTGAPPFEGTAVELMHHHLSRPPQPIAAEHGVPAALEAVVERALCKNPFERYCDAVAMRTALEAAMAGGAPEFGAPARRGWAAWVAWVMSVGLAVWVGWMASAGDEEGQALTGAASAPREAGAAAPASTASTAVTPGPAASTVAATRTPTATTASAGSTLAAPAPAAAATPAWTTPAGSTLAAPASTAAATPALTAPAESTLAPTATTAPAASTVAATPEPTAAAESTVAATPASTATTAPATPTLPPASTLAATPAPAVAAPAAASAPAPTTPTPPARAPAASPTPEAPPALDPATRPLVDALERCDCAAAARHYAALGEVAEPLRARFDARCRRFGEGCLGR